MKVFACLVLLAAAANAAIDISAPSAAFEAAGNSVPASIIENQPASELQWLVLNETALYIRKIVDNLSRELSVQSFFFARSIEKHKENFQRSVLLLDSEGAEGLDWSLRILNDIMQRALGYIPQEFGGDGVSSPVDVSSEEPMVEAAVLETNHDLHDLINNVPVLLDAAVTAVLDFQKTILNAGLSGIASTYPQLREEFSILACKENILPQLQSAILTVFANAQVTKANVKSETWETYEAISERAIAIYEILESRTD